MVVPGHAVRGVRLQLHRPDRRPRPRLADPDAARTCKQLKGPQFLHVVTKKGQGYKLAEADPVLYHGPGKFDPGRRASSRRRRRKTDLHAGVRPLAVRHGGAATSAWSASRRRCAKARAWCEFEQRFPDRYFDVGIAEQHAVTFAAGLACEGLKPVVAIYSTFLQRAYDQLIHDVALQNLPVVFALDRAGLVGADGATHAGAYDIAYLRCIPNMSVHGAGRRERVPADAATPRSATTSPAAVRYPRGAGAGVAVAAELTALPFGKGEVRRARAAQRQVAILAFGTHAACRRWRRPRSSTPRSPTCASSSRSTSSWCCELARSHDALVTVEEGCVMGGAGSAVLEALAAAQLADAGAAARACPIASSSTATRRSCWRLRARRRRHRGVDPRALRLAAGLMRPPRTIERGAGCRFDEPVARRDARRFLSSFVSPVPDPSTRACPAERRVDLQTQS